MLERAWFLRGIIVVIGPEAAVYGAFTGCMMQHMEMNPNIDSAHKL